MIGKPYRIVLNSLRIVGREDEVKRFLAGRYPGAVVIFQAVLRDSRVVTEVQTSDREESGTSGAARDVQAVISEGMTPRLGDGPSGSETDR